MQTLIFRAPGALVYHPLASSLSLSMTMAAQAGLERVLIEENNVVLDVALVTVAGKVTRKV